eukprot:GHVU01084739.1.p2 GENE.GHVU01084739.1~~GHVU01084739.1.p2  ORF type:complete len:101 (-),score=6.18 GHVU01084739.1:18-320(-)
MAMTACACVLMDGWMDGTPGDHVADRFMHVSPHSDDGWMDAGAPFAFSPLPSPLAPSAPACVRATYRLTRLRCKCRPVAYLVHTHTHKYTHTYINTHIHT